MNGKLLLDTNVIISLFGETPVLNDFILNANEVFIPYNLTLITMDKHFSLVEEIKIELL